ncbi:ATP/GTP-binding protein, partial [Enterococcus faecium]
IDIQTDALVSMIGDSQIDYRFFIGFKLIATDEEVNLKNLKKSFFSGLQEFVNGVNHHLMGHFVSLSNEGIRCYSKLEKLMKSKLALRFKVRRVKPSDLT